MNKFASYFQQLHVSLAFRLTSSFKYQDVADLLVLPVGCCEPKNLLVK